MKNSKLKILLHGLILPVAFLLGCADIGAEPVVPSAAPPDDVTIALPPEPVEPEPAEPTEPAVPEPSTVYKPFAGGHDDKFSLGDFDSPYLVQLDNYADFVADRSSIFLNGYSYEVAKVDYAGNTYVGVAGFAFNDYASFTSTNAELTIEMNLVAADGTYIASNETIASGLMVTGATNLYTWQDLQGMKHDLAADYSLKNDVTFPDKGNEGLAAAGFEPVGSSSSRFTGSFAGGGHTIANLSIERGSVNNVGMWGVVHDAGSVIKDFVVDHAGIRGNNSVAAVVAQLRSGMVSNVGVVSSAGSDVAGRGFVGGLVAVNSGTLHGYMTGAVSGTGNLVGGLAGQNNRTVIGYVTGAVSAGGTVGGLAGDNGGTVTGYVTGAVSGSGSVGALVGENYATVNGYWDESTTQASGAVNGAGLNYGAFNAVGISAVANVTFDEANNTYTDSDSGTRVFNNAAFLNHFTPTGNDGEWPTLNGTE